MWVTSFCCREEMVVTRGFPLAVVRAGCRRALSRRAVPPAVPPARSEHLLQWGWAAVLPAKGSCSLWGGSRRSNLPWIQPWHSWDPGTRSIHVLDGGCPAGVGCFPLILKLETSLRCSPGAHRALLSTTRSGAGPGPCPKQSSEPRAQRRHPEERVVAGTGTAASQPCVFDVAEINLDCCLIF